MAAGIPATTTSGGLLFLPSFPSSPTNFVTESSYLTYPGDDGSLKTATVEYLLVTASYFNGGACPAVVGYPCGGPGWRVATSTYSAITRVASAPTSPTMTTTSSETTSSLENNLSPATLVSQPSPTSSDLPSERKGLSTGAKAGLGIGIILAVLLLLLVIWAQCFRRRDRRERLFRILALPAPKKGDSENSNSYGLDEKPELEGSRPYALASKPELDGTVHGYGVPADRKKPNFVVELEAAGSEQQSTPLRVEPKSKITRKPVPVEVESLSSKALTTATLTSHSHSAATRS